MVYAFETIAEKTPNVSASQLLKVIACIARAIRDVVAGQVVDLDSEGNPDISLNTLQFIHHHKTAALIEGSVVSGGILADADEVELQRLATYGRKIGLAFQIVDDILDVTSTPEVLGKSIGKDAEAQKTTYPSLLGLEESRHQAQQLVDAAKAELTVFGERALPLVAIADFITQRTH